MKLPSYSDSEINVYHPICERALNQSLKNLNLENGYIVSHHEIINNLEADFLIKNRKTDKLLLIIEVKRKPEQVASTRFKKQAQSYIEEAWGSIEQPYYCLTNLEVTEFFKYNPNNPSVNQQIIKPSPALTGSFETDEFEVFYNNLVSIFSEMINIAYTNTGENIISYEKIFQVLSENVNYHKRWHGTFTLIAYEFIRKILDNHSRNEVTNWGNVIDYSFNSEYRILVPRFLSDIDFDRLSNQHIVQEDSSLFSNNILEESTNLARNSIDGDELGKIAHDTIIEGRQHQGMVTTDEDLADLLVTLISLVYKNNINNAKVIDPAAGSGNLLTSLISLYPNIEPENIYANDIEPQFSDILTLRLPLKFPRRISNHNKPTITATNIVNMSKHNLSEIDIILCNPPYLSGVADTNKKIEIFNKIIEITKYEPITKIGQMPLEGPFIELLTGLANPGTLIGLIIPEQHLYGLGKESLAIRKMLQKKLNLKIICIYPRIGLFKDVTKATSIVVGTIKGDVSEEDIVKFINCKVSVDKLNLESLSDIDTDYLYGVETKDYAYEMLAENTKNGWKFLLAQNIFELYNNSHIELIPGSELEIHRGPNANVGSKEYIFITRNKNWSLFSSLIPKEWLILGYNSPQDIPADKIEINSNTVKERGLNPPASAFKSNTAENSLLYSIITQFKNKEKIKQGKQIRKEKSVSDIINTLEKEKLGLVDNECALILPRNLRKVFKCFKTSEKALVSTNFVVIKCEDDDLRNVYLSWLYSIFGQVQLEYWAKPQEGTRKMEMKNFKQVRFPIDKVTHLPELPTSRNFSDYYLRDNEHDLFWKNHYNISNEIYYSLKDDMRRMIHTRNP